MPEYQILIHAHDEKFPVEEKLIEDVWCSENETLSNEDEKCPRCFKRLEVSALEGTKQIKYGEHGEQLFYYVAMCNYCDKAIGTIKISPSTLFGYDEDSRMLNSAPKIF